MYSGTRNCGDLCQSWIRTRPASHLVLGLCNCLSLHLTGTESEFLTSKMGCHFHLGQEGSARLTLTSGKSLGECLRIKYRNLHKFYNVSIICWMVSISVFVGNTLYECNNWAGGMSAIYVLPGTESFWVYPNGDNRYCLKVLKILLPFEFLAALAMLSSCTDCSFGTRLTICPWRLESSWLAWSFCSSLWSATLALIGQSE